MFPITQLPHCTTIFHSNSIQPELILSSPYCSISIKHFSCTGPANILINQRAVSIESRLTRLFFANGLPSHFHTPSGGPHGRESNVTKHERGRSPSCTMRHSTSMIQISNVGSLLMRRSWFSDTTTGQLLPLRMPISFTHDRPGQSCSFQNGHPMGTISSILAWRPRCPNYKQKLRNSFPEK